jgi:hypothetical protein
LAACRAALPAESRRKEIPMYDGNIRRAREFIGAVLLLESMATLLVALWLVLVTFIVLPSRDPGHVTMWRAVAGGFLAFCGLSWSAVVVSHRTPWIRRALLMVSLLAMTLGVYGIASQTGQHFEGYIVLMGLILSVHGATGIAYSLIAGRSSGLADRLAGHAR